jgi:trk system potassium uptake protein
VSKSKRVIILGCGRQGARLAELLEGEGFEVAVIDEVSHKRLKSPTIERIVGNGTDRDVLQRAGLQDAFAFAAVTNGDNTNLMTAQMARLLFNVEHVVCRVYDPQRAKLYHDLGLETVSATTVGARMLRNLILAPKILRQYQMGDGSGLTVEFKLGACSAGRPLAELEIPGEFRISGVIRDQQPFIPDASYVAQDGDHILGTVMARSLQRLQEALQIFDSAVNPVSQTAGR